MKASDVFRETEYVFGKTTEFGRAFPTIAELRVEVEECGGHVPDWARKNVYTHTSGIGEYIDCRNPRCCNGGFRLGEIIRHMESVRKTTEELTRHCQGYEGSPKGRKNYGPCDHYFKIKVAITYKDSET